MASPESQDRKIAYTRAMSLLRDKHPAEFLTIHMALTQQVRKERLMREANEAHQEVRDDQLD